MKYGTQSNPWTEEQSNWLLQNYYSMSNPKLADKFKLTFNVDRSVKSLEHKMSLLTKEENEVVINITNEWGDELYSYISDNYLTQSDIEISRVCQVPRIRVAEARRELGLRRPSKRKLSSKGERLPSYQRQIDKLQDKRTQLKNIRDQIREDEGCLICGLKVVSALDFHHVNPEEKEHNISLIHNEELLREEIDKCVVLCANHHRMVHAGDIILKEHLVDTKVSLPVDN